MAARSPNYPAVSLPDAIEMAQKLWKKEQRTAVSPEVTVKAFGYGALSGPARVALGAMRKYGLLDKTPNGFRLSDLALQVLHPETVEAKQAAIREAAMRPELFRELSQTHLNASDDALRSHLINKKRFVERGTRQLIASFRDTMALAKAGQEGYSGGTGPEDPDDMAESTQNTSQPLPPPGNKPTDGAFTLNVPFSKGTISVQVRVVGDAISPAHLARVRKYLELAESEWDGGDE